ncbi:transcriptional regulator [Sphaerisporangium siamense]|uniref:DNA-binding MarR family transcriptional regulator n=1 Tax=Sphaerisporangium siamense TaxID=795645 RepID=A0A7W7D3T9_9ACTN|nr:MarR family winged helix-turn-helix transcriptional regulator [Sphaerisporangium siamense]MBB4698840.1 DNA-binding MarR family transcriptional regulator [Sphaerisporangium siamense]GII89026.1 transcriptional regulator [Sphaerisporangium siamense]
MTETQEAPPVEALGGIPREEYETYCALERQLGILFRRSRALSAEMGRAVHPELEPGAYGILVRIDEAAPARPSDLAGFFGVGKGTISRQLKVLEELGLIGREPDPLDGRAHLLDLTQEGRERLHRARTARQRRFYALLGTWPQEDVRLLGRMLERFNALGENTGPEGQGASGQR